MEVNALAAGDDGLSEEAELAVGMRRSVRAREEDRRDMDELARLRSAGGG